MRLTSKAVEMKRDDLTDGTTAAGKAPTISCFTSTVMLANLLLWLISCYRLIDLTQLINLEQGQWVNLWLIVVDYSASVSD